MKHYYKICLTAFSIFIIISCAESDSTTSSDNPGPIYQGPFYNEFLACDAGPDYTDDNAREMLSAYKELKHDENLLWSGVYAPKVIIIHMIMDGGN